VNSRDHYFQALIENATDIITVLNRDGTRRYVSPSVERALGYRPEDLIGKQPFDLLHPEDAPEMLALFTTGLAAPETTISRQYRIRHQDGSWRIHEATARNLLDEPSVAGIVINSRDITDRVRDAQRVAAQHSVTRILAESATLIDAAPEILRTICQGMTWDMGLLWCVDPDAGLLRFVESWHVPTIAPAEFEAVSRGRTFPTGVGLPGRIWAAAAPVWIADIASDPSFPRAPIALRDGLSAAFGLPILLAGTVLGVIEFFSVTMRQPDPDLLEMMTAITTQVGQFIERRRVAEEREQVVAREQRARREAEAAIARMRRVQTVTEDALAHLSLDGLLAELLDRIRDTMQVDTVAILLVEATGHELVSWAARGLEEEVERRVRIPFGVGFAGRVAAEKAPVCIDDVDRAEVFNPLLREKGIRSLLGVPLLVEGRVVGVLHVGTLTPHQFAEDDTRLLQLVADRVALAIDHARLFEEERVARREAEAANRAMDEFLTTLSHELRTPLTPIIGWVHMIRNGILVSGESEHGLSVIEKNAHALKRLINDLLDMSAIVSGKMRMERLAVRVSTIVSEAIDTVRPMAAERDIEVEMSFPDWHEPVLVTGDPARLVQVFWNLLHNSVKFSNAGGLVRVCGEANGGEVLVRVEDSGQGIKPEFLPHVFERFRQADGSKTRAHGGLGLGLALAKSFVEAHGGSVAAESAGQGKGSSFTVRLPRQIAEAPASDQTRIRATSRVHPAHLLVIEDDEDTLEMLRATFAAQGYRVTACESATDALKVVDNGPFDLIISDIGMPRIDGYELIRRLRMYPQLRTVPAIALTGYASKKDAEAARTAGFDAHLSKPVGPAELAALTDQLLERGSDDNADSPVI
jgi:PAS domain S-box-containing protein